jgi:NAD-dependent dihydropyrimidine dehydrogenase PreA subunit
MKKDNKSIPSWVWMIIILLVLFILFMFYILYIDSKNNQGLDSTEKLCIEQCNMNDHLCISQVTVYGWKDDCSPKFSSCIERCPF